MMRHKRLIATTAIFGAGVLTGAFFICITQASKWEAIFTLAAEGHHVAQLQWTGPGCIMQRKVNQWNGTPSMADEDQLSWGKWLPFSTPTEIRISGDLIQPEMSGRALHRLSSVKTLSIAGVENLPIQFFNALGDHQGVTSLYVIDCPIEDNMAKAFSAFPSVENLAVTGGLLTGETIPRLNSLISIDFTNSPITDEGLEHILAGCDPERLTLNRTAVTNRCLDFLDRESRLRSLRVRNTSVTQQALGVFGKAHPTIDIEVLKTGITN